MASGVILLPSIEKSYLTGSTRTISQILPALGPEWIRHTIEHQQPEHRIRIVYGDHQEVRCLDDVLCPEDKFVGFSCTGLSYRPILPLVEEARRRNIPALVGGTHARLMGERISRRLPGVSVVAGPGEKAVADILNGIPLDRVEGLLRPGQETGIAKGVPYEFKPFLHTTTDYTPFFDAWATSGVKLYRDGGADKLIAVRGITGCTKTKPCSFCTVQRVQPFDPLERGRYLAEERRSILNVFGERVYILDCSDALPNQECLEAIAKHLNGDTRTRVHCGAMVWDLVRPERFAAALRAGYDDFLIGLEGYARQHLPLADKPKDSIEILLKLLRQSRGTRARYFISGIVGWAGECEETLREAFETIVRILEYESVVTVAVNFLMPMPGSALHWDLVKQGLLDPEDECPNMHVAFARHVRRNCVGLTLDQLREFTQQTMALDSRVIQVWGCEREFEDEERPPYSQFI